MNDIIEGEYSFIDLATQASEEISPYDSAYPIMLLANGLKSGFEQAQLAIKQVYKAVSKEAPIIAQIQQSTKKGFRYVVDASEETLKAIDSGKIKLTTEKSGKTFAQIREANGRYGSKLPIKKEVFGKGIDPVQMANAIQMQALQVQLEEIADQINLIDRSVKAVLQGQQNDRIGLYYSGMALFLESKNVSDSEMKRLLVSQSLRALSESTFQLVLNMQSNIQYLVDGEYKSAKGKKVELIDSHMLSINQSFAVIHQASLLRAGIYCSQGEFAAMSTVLGEYSRFIDGTVAKNAPLLAQCDTSDNGSKDGIWQQRTNLKLDVAGLIKQLNSPDKTVYLAIAEESA